jgi:hypothetical protein
MPQLIESLQQFLSAAWNLLLSIFGLFGPNLGLWLFLAAWIAYFLFAVNWVHLRRVLLDGGWVGLLLIGLVIILVWGTVAPPDGYHSLFGLRLSNYVGKTVYVTALACIMLLCGSIQLAGFSRHQGERGA